jgi:hypothetical protein
VSRVLVASIVGPTRATIEAGGNRSTFDALKLHLTALCVGYLKEVSTTARPAAVAADQATAAVPLPLRSGVGSTV